MSCFEGDKEGNGTSYRQVMKRLEVAPPKNGTYAIDAYTNPDLVPVDKTRRTWGGWDYVVYWATGGFAIYNYSTGSALIAFGLSGKQALAAGIFSPIALAALAITCGWIGGSHNIPYPVASRMSWGMRGTYFAILIRAIPAMIWDSIEAFWGGQAVSTCIGAMSLSWANWDYPLADGTLQLKDFIGFLIYYVVFLAVMWLPPHKLHRPFLISCVGFCITVLGMLIWAVKQANGTGGPYFARSYRAESFLADSMAWAVVYGATAVLCNTTMVTLGQADWTRFSRNGNKVPTICQAIACPIMIYLAFALGIIITSAAAEVLGEALWQPYLLLRRIQQYHDNSTKARVAVFFASAVCAYAQVCVNIILNSVSVAMDITAYNPRWITIKRGAYFIAAVGLALNPWQLTVNAKTFIAVINGFGIFYGPCSGILVSDFFVVHKRLVKMDDIYRGNSDSIYWYWKGFNWRAFAAFVLSVFPAMPGYIMGCVDLERSPNSWMKLSRLGFITGFTIAFLLYWVFNLVSPPPGIGEGVPRHDEDTLVLPSAYRQDVPTQGQYSVPLDGEAVHGEVVSVSGMDKGSEDNVSKIHAKFEKDLDD